MAKRGDLSVTALYTSQTATWGKLPYAELFATPEARRVFDATNAALAVAGVVKRGVSLRHSVLHRQLMIDRLVREASCTRVIELAAGLSRRGASFTEDPRVRYVEIDLPHVIERKKALLARTPEGRAVAGRVGLELIEGDVETIELSLLVRAGEPVIVIAEGLFMYFAADARRRLFAAISRLAETTGELRFVFDLVPSSEEPAQGMIGRVLEAAMKRFTGGRTFERDARTRDEIVGELRAAGFEDIAIHDSAQVAHAWELPEPDQATKVVLFACAIKRGGSRATPA